MKIAVVAREKQRLEFYEAESCEVFGDAIIGFIDLPIEKPKKTWKDAVDLGKNCECSTCGNRYCKCEGRNPDGSFGKKTVTKEAKLRTSDYGCLAWTYSIPPGAKNVKCTYEIDE